MELATLFITSAVSNSIDNSLKSLHLRTTENLPFDCVNFLSAASTALCKSLKRSFKADVALFH